MNYCPYDMCVLQQEIIQENMLYVCNNCGFNRELENTETLLFEKQKSGGYITSAFNAKDIALDKINKRIPIDCKCGSKLGVLYISGEECDVMRICTNCYKNVN
jgi:hypothetical protein